MRRSHPLPGPAGRPRSEVGRTLAGAFGLGTFGELAGPVDRGEQGQVWRLTTTHGGYAVKETFPGSAVAITEEHAARCLAFQREAEHAAVLAPAQHRTRAGTVRLVLDEVPLRVFDWVELAPANPAIDPASVGRVLAGLHRTRLAAGSEPDPWFTEPVGVATWDRLIGQAAAAGAPFSLRLAAHRDDLVALEEVYRPMRPVQLCHLDLFADNVRVSDGGRLCVIDWDNCGPADPDRELGFCLFEYARTDPHRGAELAGAYREAGGVGRVREPADFGLVAAVIGHIGALSLGRWLDAEAAGDLPAAALAAASIEEFLTDPPSLPLIDRLLTAAAG